jgi:hypothetical protein
MNVMVVPKQHAADNRLADLPEDMRETRWSVEDIAGDMHRQAEIFGGWSTEIVYSDEQKNRPRHPDREANP